MATTLPCRSDPACGRQGRLAESRRNVEHPVPDINVGQFNQAHIDMLGGPFPDGPMLLPARCRHPPLVALEGFVLAWIKGWRTHRWLVLLGHGRHTCG